MQITAEQRDHWRQRTAESPFNTWLDAQVRTPEGNLSLELLYAVGRAYGIDKQGQYDHLNPGQQRMTMGNLLRRRVPPAVYGAAAPNEPALAEEAALDPIDVPKSIGPDQSLEAIRSATVRELLIMHASIMSELRSRAIIRTSNAPLGDYAELLFANAFSWDLESNSSSGHDAIDISGIRYQVKARRLTSYNKSRQLSAIRRLPDTTFDVLAAALFNEDYTVRRAALIPHSVVVTLAKRREHTNSWLFLLHDRVWEIDGVRDVTQQLIRAAQDY